MTTDSYRRNVAKLCEILRSNDEIYVLFRKFQLSSVRTEPALSLTVSYADLEKSIEASLGPGRALGYQSGIWINPRGNPALERLEDLFEPF